MLIPQWGINYGLTLFFAGRDATEAFEDVGHSDEAREYLPPMLVGDFEKGDVCSLAFPSATLSDVDTYFRASHAGPPGPVLPPIPL